MFNIACNLRLVTSQGVKISSGHMERSEPHFHHTHMFNRQGIYPYKQMPHSNAHKDHLVYFNESHVLVKLNDMHVELYRGILKTSE